MTDSFKSTIAHSRTAAPASAIQKDPAHLREIAPISSLESKATTIASEDASKKGDMILSKDEKSKNAELMTTGPHESYEGDYRFAPIKVRCSSAPTSEGQDADLSRTLRSGKSPELCPLATTR